KFAVREQAIRELEQLGDLAGPALRQALAQPLSLETSQRLQLLVDRLERLDLTPEQLRPVRAVGGLGYLYTPQAQHVLPRLPRRAANPGSGGSAGAEVSGKRRIAAWHRLCQAASGKQESSCSLAMTYPSYAPW